MELRVRIGSFVFKVLSPYYSRKPSLITLKHEKCVIEKWDYRFIVYCCLKCLVNLFFGGIRKTKITSEHTDLLEINRDIVYQTEATL